MNPLFVSRALKSISYSELPEGVKYEYEGRGETRFRLPDWVRRPNVKKEARKSRELAKLKAEHGQ